MVRGKNGRSRKSRYYNSCKYKNQWRARSAFHWRKNSTTRDCSELHIKNWNQYHFYAKSLKATGFPGDFRMHDLSQKHSKHFARINMKTAIMNSNVLALNKWKNALINMGCHLLVYLNFQILQNLIVMCYIYGKTLWKMSIVDAYVKNSVNTCVRHSDIINDPDEL